MDQSAEWVLDLCEVRTKAVRPEEGWPGECIGTTMVMTWMAMVASGKGDTWADLGDILEGNFIELGT